ncbi:MAG: hypothetical protein EXS63_07935 [Candidatus Omnitrophica bacterium]|nr:hypothetical protein [Candidatus Omnitrophota bacterium]
MKASNNRQKISILVLSLLLLMPFSHLSASAAVEELQPGLHTVPYKNAEYMVFLPLSFSPEKKYPLIVISYIYTGVKDIDPSEMMDSWSRVAEEREYVVVLPIVGGIDEKIIEWYRDLLKDVKARYSINRSHVLLTGFGDGAHFAYYLGTTIPEEFSAVSPVAGTLKGSWERRIYFKKSDRRPFLILSGAADSKVPSRAIQESAEKLKSQGYDVSYEELPGEGHTYSDTTVQKIADWFGNLAG